jgi:hypothetical protein
MNTCFALTFKHTPKLASAISLKEPKPEHELISALEGKSSMPFAFELRKITETKNGIVESADLTGLRETWLDLQPNSLAWPMMSARMRELIEGHLTGNEGVDWIKCKVHGEGEIRTYYILRFTKKLNVLDKKKTHYVPGTDLVIKPVFSLAKIDKYSIFHNELSRNFWKITPSLYVCELLKKAMQKEKLTGVSLEKAAAA